MAIKISELAHIIKSGARTNKYRVIFPHLGREIDVLCSEISSPGRNIGTTEVFLRGRKYLIAGDRSDDGTIEITFYNDSELRYINIFLDMINSIQSYDTPIYLKGVQNPSNTFLTYRNDVPLYQFDLTIEQLDENMNVTSRIKLLNAFVNIVGDIQYTDETGEVSKTTVTLSYTGMEVR
jgi:hypothetical protein